MSRITTKNPQKSILARIFGLRQGFKDKSFPGQEIGETRTQYHPWYEPFITNLSLKQPQDKAIFYLMRSIQTFTPGPNLQNVNT